MATLDFTTKPFALFSC
ncbi:unnamed protein product [Debaryomyces fabryi]|nr:unnamed protein product [Debaryomyces fabryi]